MPLTEASSVENTKLECLRKTPLPKLRTLPYELFPYANLS